MKKWSLSLIFFLMAQICYNIAPVLSQEKKESLDIKNVIEAFIKDTITLGDVNSALQLVSVNYSSIQGNNTIDYTKFKSGLEKWVALHSKKYVNTSATPVEILKSDIKDNKAALEIEYGWKGFNLDTLAEVNSNIKMVVSLIKEDGTWKIANWSKLVHPKE
jgi:hypothetical protein